MRMGQQPQWRGWGPEAGERERERELFFKFLMEDNWKQILGQSNFLVFSHEKEDVMPNGQQSGHHSWRKVTHRRYFPLGFSPSSGHPLQRDNRPSSPSLQMQSSVLPRVPITTVFNLLTLTLSLLPLPSLPLSLCRTSCGAIPVGYPFAIDDGCGSPSFRRMLSCNASDLFFATPSGDYKVQSIDYAKRKVVVFDPAMSTCSILQPHHDFALTDVQAALIPPSDDTIFAVLNCSIDSPVANHFKYLCSPNVGGHSCDEMYGACSSFRIFRSAAPQGGNQSSPLPLPSTSPPCCFTRYATVRFMSMNMLDCTHYTTVINSGGLVKSGPLDWTYGIELTYAVPESTACDRCKRSGGTCGFDTETAAMLCLCSPTLNATVECAPGTGIGSGQKLSPTVSFHATLIIILTSIIYTNLV